MDKLIQEKIQKFIKDKLKENLIISNNIIKDGIFKILESQCTVIYYPLKNESNKGFHTQKIVNNRMEDFVYINTAKPIAEQIFTAAHELGHIWNIANYIRNKLDNEAYFYINEEEITNLFAAELLMPANEFKELFIQHKTELDIIGLQLELEEMIRIMVLLMNDFMVSYESIRRRLEETEIINLENSNILLDNQNVVNELITIFMSDNNTNLEKETNVKTISGLRSLLEKAQTENSDEYLLKKIKDEFKIKDPVVKEDFKIYVEDPNV